MGECVFRIGPPSDVTSDSCASMLVSEKRTTGERSVASERVSNSTGHVTRCVTWFAPSNCFEKWFVSLKCVTGDASCTVFKAREKTHSCLAGSGGESWVSQFRTKGNQINWLTFCHFFPPLAFEVWNLKLPQSGVDLKCGSISIWFPRIRLAKAKLEYSSFLKGSGTELVLNLFYLTADYSFHILNAFIIWTNTFLINKYVFYYWQIRLFFIHLMINGPV